MVPTNDFSGFASTACAFAKAAARLAIEVLERCMRTLLAEEIDANRARLRALGPTPMPDCLLGVLRHQLFQLGFGLLMSRWADRVRAKITANSAQVFALLMSTTRTASMRGLGGSAPKRRGGSPLSTQRQNLRSAVTMRYW
jgi:hypothetical protein